jgi:hypothetical protein
MRSLTTLIDYFHDERHEILLEALGRGAEIYPLKLLAHCLDRRIKDLIIRGASPRKIAKICGYRYSNRLIQALQQSGFLVLMKSNSGPTQFQLRIFSDRSESRVQYNESVDNQSIQIRTSGGDEVTIEDAERLLGKAETASLFPPDPLSTPLLSLKSVVFKAVNKKNKVKVVSKGEGEKKNRARRKNGKSPMSSTA